MLTDLMLRLRSLFRREAVEDDLDDELQFHLEQQVKSYVDTGLDPEVARRRARLEFGNLDSIREEHRDARGVRALEDLLRDLQYAARQLKRAPGFTALAVLALFLVCMIDAFGGAALDWATALLPLRRALGTDSASVMRQG